MLILLWPLVCLPVFGLSQTPYFLTIESAPAAAIDGTVYRFYVQSETTTDKISAVFGTNEDPLVIDTPEGIFNSSFNSSWSASGINPAFLAIVPEMADDSYATIGLEGPASTSGIEGAADPSIVEDESLALTVSEYFVAGGTELVVNTVIGASWYVLNTATNALPVDSRWLVAQVTTSGDISGQLNYQIFPEGNGDNDVQVSLSFDGAGVFGTAVVEGCMDEAACNYNPAALLEDDSCEFASCAGCTNPAACNFNEEASIEDQSCLFCDCGAGASGYSLIVTADPAASSEGAHRFRFYIQMANDGDRMSAVFGNTERPIDIAVPNGAFNSALNSSWNATGLNPVFVASFPELADDTYATIGLDGPASTSGIEGAADPGIAEDATQPLTPFFLNNGATQLVANQIIGSSWFVLNTAGNALPNANGRSLVLQITTTGQVSGSLNVQIIPEGAASLEDVQKSFVFDGPGIYAPVGEGNPCGCTDPEAENFDPTAGYDDGSCIVAEIFGCTNSASCNFNEEAEIDDGSCEDLDALDVCGGDCLADEDVDGVCDDVDDCVGEIDACGVCNGPGDIYECGCASIPEGDCDCQGNQLDALGVCGGNCAADADADGICDDIDECVGDFDACGICNGPGDIYECGCSDILEGDCDCEGNQLDALGVCGGNCAADDDADGICDDVDPCVGSPEECCSDFNQNGLCDATETVGCTFPGAPNYQPEATMDNGTCISSCYGDLNGDGHIQLSDLLDLLQGFGLYCDEID